MRQLRASTQDIQTMEHNNDNDNAEQIRHGMSPGASNTGDKRQEKVITGRHNGVVKGREGETREGNEAMRTIGCQNMNMDK